jgi:hypothetical protein
MRPIMAQDAEHSNKLEELAVLVVVIIMVGVAMIVVGETDMVPFRSPQDIQFTVPSGVLPRICT